MSDVVFRDNKPAAARAKHDVASFGLLQADDQGQGLAEYGLILGFIAILCIAAIVYFSGNLQGLLNNVGSNI